MPEYRGETMWRHSEGRGLQGETSVLPNPENGEKFEGHAAFTEHLLTKQLGSVPVSASIFINSLYKYILNYRFWSWWEYN